MFIPWMSRAGVPHLHVPRHVSCHLVRKVLCKVPVWQLLGSDIPYPEPLDPEKQCCGDSSAEHEGGMGVEGGEAAVEELQEAAHGVLLLVRSRDWAVLALLAGALPPDFCAAAADRPPMRTSEDSQCGLCRRHPHVHAHSLQHLH